MTSRDLGIMLACAECGVSPAEFPYRSGMAKVASRSDKIGRCIANASADILTFCGRGDTAPAHHLRMVAKSSAWYPQFDEAVNLCVKAAMAVQTFQKQALHSGDLVGGAGSVLQGLGYGSLIAGTGLGSLSWLLSRHASQDEANIEAMKRQRDYYNQLSSEIEDSMRRKYQYEQQAKPDAKRR